MQEKYSNVDAIAIAVECRIVLNTNSVIYGRGERKRAVNGAWDVARTRGAIRGGKRSDGANEWHAEPHSGLLIKNLKNINQNHKKNIKTTEHNKKNMLIK